MTEGNKSRKGDLRVRTLSKENPGEVKRRKMNRPFPVARWREKKKERKERKKDRKRKKERKIEKKRKKDRKKEKRKTATGISRSCKTVNAFC